MNKPYVYFGSNEISQNKQICASQNEKKMNKSFIKVKLMIATMLNQVPFALNEP